MIEISDRWAIDNGPYENDYCLIEFKQGTTRQGEPKLTEVKTYHNSIQAICNRISKVETINSIKTIENLNELIEAQQSMIDVLSKEIKGHVILQSSHTGVADQPRTEDPS